jgi:hypothetical protein
MVLNFARQEQWGEALREARNLRVLTLPVLCFEDAVDQHSDHDDNGDDDVSMELDTIPDDGPVAGPSRISEESSHENHSASSEEVLPSWLRPFYQPLAIFAEDLIDVYLRSSGFKELRFIYDISPRTQFRQCRIIRFAQVLDPERDPSSTHTSQQYMMKYLGVMDEGLEEDDALYWMPRELRRW